MVQGPQLIHPSPAAVVKNRLDTPLRIEPGSSGSDHSYPISNETYRDRQNVEEIARKSVADAIISNHGNAAALVHAETARQIAHNTLVALQGTFEKMGTLGQQALDPTLTEAGRAVLDTALNAFIQDVATLIAESVLNGARILEHLAGSEGGLLIDLPSILPAVLSPQDASLFGVEIVNLGDWTGASLLTEESAQPVVDQAAVASGQMARQIERLGSLRSVLEEKVAIAAEPDQTQGFADIVVLPEKWAPLQTLSRAVSDQISGGGDAPFQDQGERLRTILGMAFKETETPIAGLMTGPAAAGDTSAASLSLQPSQSQRAGEAPVILPRTVMRQVTTLDLRAQIGNAAETEGNRAGDHQIGRTPMAGLSPNQVSVDPSHAVAVTTEKASEFEAIVPPVSLHRTEQEGRSDRPDARPAPLYQSSPAGTTPVTNSGAIAKAKIPSTASPGLENIEAFHSLADGARDRPEVLIVTAALDLGLARNQVTAEIRMTELSKIGELDAARRPTGLVQQTGEADARADVGLSAAKTIFDSSADRLEEFGAAIPADPGGLMAELIRADTILQTADAAIVPIDLHLEYLRGLAEEATTDRSRDRGALDDIFQAVKTNIIDTLARTTEAHGGKILAGGNGRNGEYLFRLSEGGATGEGHEIALPSLRTKDISPDLHFSEIRTPETAFGALDALDAATAEISQIRDMIGEERTLIQRLISIEVAQNASWSPLARSALGV